MRHQVHQQSRFRGAFWSTAFNQHMHRNSFFLHFHLPLLISFWRQYRHYQYLHCVGLESLVQQSQHPTLNSFPTVSKLNQKKCIEHTQCANRAHQLLLKLRLPLHQCPRQKVVDSLEKPTLVCTERSISGSSGKANNTQVMHSARTQLVHLGQILQRSLLSLSRWKRMSWEPWNSWVENEWR